MTTESAQRSKGRWNLLLWWGKRLRTPLNHFLERQSLVTNGPLLDATEIPRLGVLAANWLAIRDELRFVMRGREAIPSLNRISPDHRRIAPEDKWKSYFLLGHGYAVEANRARCPVTSATIDEVPGVVVAFFSIFEPGTHVPPHRGVSKAMVNVHLGLIVPDDPGRCEIEVGGEVRAWAEGELLVLDETYRHEAWNLTAEPRVVLFLQVRRPMRRPGRMLGDVFLWLMRRTTYVQEARKAIGATRKPTSAGKRQPEHA